jgi:glutamate N-acetyltransferase/amino-acid N-acetyltransferase
MMTNVITAGIPGFRFSAAAAGIKEEGSTKLDLGLVVADRPCVAACVTTRNLVCAPPVTLTRERLQSGLCRAVLVNAGNANASTGIQGRIDAEELTNIVAEKLCIESNLVVPMSTGVIGTPMPTDRIRQQIDRLVAGLSPERWGDFARAIMTTDTTPKTVIQSDKLSNGIVRMMGIGKGAGMIAPNMATMLAVVLTNVRPDAELLREYLARAVEASFNCITVDGDTSTNDTVVVMGGPTEDALPLSADKADREVFASMLQRVCYDLARQMIFDGEGATKLVEIRVVGAPDERAAHKVARTVAESLLVKTALHGEDPNWGRIVAAAGRADVDLDPDRLDLSIGDVPVLEKSDPVSGDWETPAHEVMTQREFSITLGLNVGDSEARMLTTDLSADYVRINADYRS